MITDIQDRSKHAFHNCQRVADGIQKEAEIGRGKNEDCSEASRCLVVDSFEDTYISPTRNEGEEDMQTISTQPGLMEHRLETKLFGKRANTTILRTCRFLVGFVVSMLIRAEIQI